MKNHTFIHSVLGMALLFTTVGACGDDGNDDESTGVVPSTTAVDPSTTGDVPTTSMPTTIDPDTTMPTTIDPDTTTTVDPDTTSGTTGDNPGYNFPDAPFEDYTQIDRHGAVEAGTAGIRASGGLGLNGEDIAIRDAYNASNPVDDADLVWFDEIAASVTFFHTALDMQLMDLGLTPATIDKTVAQAGPVIIPDTIKYDAKAPVGYPNGRALTDPVVDITLAAVLLDLDVHPLNALVGALNPETNDVPFNQAFPYLAPPHQ